MTCHGPTRGSFTASVSDKYPGDVRLYQDGPQLLLPTSLCVESVVAAHSVRADEQLTTGPARRYRCLAFSPVLYQWSSETYGTEYLDFEFYLLDNSEFVVCLSYIHSRKVSSSLLW